MSVVQYSLSALMVFAGTCIPVMAAANARLGVELGSPMRAVTILCLVATAMAVALLFGSSSPPVAGFAGHPLLYLAGVLFVLYIGGITVSAPRIGLGNAIFFVIVGQLVSAAVIDHQGWLGAAQTPLSFKRGVGLLLTVVGVYCAKSGS